MPNKIQKNSSSLEHKSVNPSSVFVNDKSTDSEESDEIPDIEPIQEIPPFKFPTPVNTITGQKKHLSLQNLVHLLGNQFKKMICLSLMTTQLNKLLLQANL